MSHLAEDEWITVSEFARRADCDTREVYRAIEKGVISRRNDGLMAAAEAAGQWRKPNRRTVSRKARQQGATTRVVADVVAGGATTVTDDETPAEAAERIVAERPLLTLDQALQLKENYLGRLKQLEYDMKVGAVVLVADVAKAVGAEYATVRTRLLAIPSERSPSLHRLKTVPELEDELRSVIVKALEGLTLDRAPTA